MTSDTALDLAACVAGAIGWALVGLWHLAASRRGDSRGWFRAHAIGIGLVAAGFTLAALGIPLAARIGAAIGAWVINWQLRPWADMRPRHRARPTTTHLDGLK